MKFASAAFASLCLLIAILMPPSVRAEQVVFSEIMYHPSGELPEFIEVQNLTATPFDIALWELAGGVGYRFPDFSEAQATDSFLKAFERIVLTGVEPSVFREAYGLPEAIRVFGPWEGKLSDDGERVTLKDKNGVKRCTVRYNDRDTWPVAADGAGHALVLKDDSMAIDDYRAWGVSPGPGGTPGNPEPAQPEEPYPNPSVDLTVGIPFIDYGDRWDFHDGDRDLGTTWRETNYNFTHPGWTRETAAGNNGGLYGFENSGVPEPGMRTPLNDVDQLTYYFRKEFDYSGDTAGASITIDLINDDGSGFWLNGQWLGGVATTPGAGHDDTASRTVGNAGEELAVVRSSSAPLVRGKNVLAAALKQTNTTSSDAVFAARLSISTPLATSVIINEVLPAGAGEGFVEFYNPGNTEVDLSGWFVSDDPGNLKRGAISAGVVVPAKGSATVGFVESSLRISGNTSVFLTQSDGTTVANAISTPMPLDGRSLGRKPEGSGSWFLFAGPTPGSGNVSAGGSGSALGINELHVNEEGLIDWVEFYNGSQTSASIDGLFVASMRDFSDKRALEDSIPGGGFASVATRVDVGDVDRSVSLFLIDESNTVIDAITVSLDPDRRHVAAFPDGSKTFYVSGVGSKDAANDPDRETDIVITELMVEPPSGHRDGEYVELHNKGANTVDLSSWKFDLGISYTFPSGTTLEPGAYLAVAANQKYTSEAHPAAVVLGPYSGNFANGGERVRLVDAWGNPAEELHYHTGGDWPALAGGLGSSLELRHPAMDNTMGSAWIASDEADKSTFQVYVIKDRYLQLRTAGTPRDYEELHMHAVGDAHLALKGMRLTSGANRTNFLPNDGLQVATNGDGAEGWLCQGTHFASKRVGNEFHLISDGHGDVKANRCEIDVVPIARNNDLTFQFQARWISGKPTLVVNTWDRSFGGIVHLPIPKNLGTPGAPNSGETEAPAPTLTALLHSPAVPSSSDPVVVTARVHSATPLTSVSVCHRLDNATGNKAWATTGMVDNGTNGDEIPGDGLYTSTITQYQGDNSVVQFYVEAASAGGVSRQPTLAPERSALWVVDNSSVPGDLRTQRFVISEQALNALGGAGESGAFDFAFPRLSNHYFNATFISNERDIIYNCELRKSGSPWTRSGDNNLSRAKWKTPGDRRFRGYSKRAIDNDAGGGRAYHNRIIRYWLYLFGHPANENEFVRVIVNGGSASLREDVEPNANDFLKRNWEDGQRGELYRIDDEWWFDDDWGRQNRNADWSYKDTDEAERYHAEWIKRSRETEYDYSSFVNWVKAVGENDFSRDEIERMADIDMMAANAVVRGWCDDWDTLTRNRGKNGYFLRRHSDNRWMLIQWDSDLTFGNANAAFIGNLSGVRNFFGKPYVEQRVNYYLGQMIDKYTANSPRLAAWFEVEEDASNSYSSNEGTYTSWNENRLSTARSTIGNSALNQNFNVISGNGTSATTANDTIDLRGTSPYNAFNVRVVDHPEAEWQFASESAWTLTGIELAQGENSLRVEAVDAEGNVVGTETFRVTKTGNAAPVIDVNAKPNSYHVALHDSFEMDVRDTYDPEGSTMSYAWAVNPQSDVQLLLTENDSVGTAAFVRPGLYEFTVTASDDSAKADSAIREAAVYALNGWSPFTEPLLEDHWSLRNVSVRDGSGADTWYSLEDRPGKLTMMIQDATKSFSPNTLPYPVILRPLPESTDWALETDVKLVSIQTGDFMAGATVELMENGTLVRYSMVMEDGKRLAVRRNNASLTSVPWEEANAAVRIRRVDDELRFDYQEGPGQWATIHTRPLINTTAIQGGLFISTDAVQSVRVEFDYALLVDPAATSPALTDLRISEIMYHPAGEGGSEYIELHNRGAAAISLAGVNFEATRPFESLVLGDEELAPGEYAVVVADTAAFQAVYGTDIRILGQWAGGAISNGGERIVLRDTLGNVIHDFSFSDGEPWPTAADGGGPSLEIIDVAGDYEDATNWSVRLGAIGSPGTPPSTDPIPDNDTDGDGLTDVEEAALGTSPTQADTDGDGMADGAEVAAGTDPHDRASLFKILTITRSGDDSTVTTSWSSVAGKRYALQASASLSSDNWVDMDTITASSAVTEKTEPASSERQFYRVRLQQD
ncbi:lamin tail domain-containing protein [bacterium]|nr:lamin tail domain-containing protein [bacterium]